MAALTSEQRQTLADAADEIERSTHERSLEFALATVADIFDRLDGQALRDALVHLVARLDEEVRRQAVVTSVIIQSVGVAAEDPMLTQLHERAAL
jgi:hypothetical protein